jgi:hypothetical protein
MTCEYAAKGGRFHCLLYAISHGCPFNPNLNLKVLGERN